MGLNYPSDWTNMNPHIPFVGKWKRKITLIDQMWMQPCGPSPVLIAAGAFVALPELVFSVLQPDCLDHTFDRVGRPHRRRRRPSFNINDYMDPIVAPKGGVGYAMWQGAKLAQRLGFYALIVDSFQNWIIAGTSLAFRWNGCDDPTQGHATLGMSNTVVALLPAGSLTINTWVLQSAHIFAGGGTGIATPTGHEVGVGFSLSQNTGTIPALPDASWDARIVDTITGAGSGTMDPYDGIDGRKQIAWQGNQLGGPGSAHNFVIHLNKSFGVLNMDGTFTAGGWNNGGILDSACGSSNRGFG